MWQWWICRVYVCLCGQICFQNKDHSLVKSSWLSTMDRGRLIFQYQSQCEMKKNELLKPKVIFCVLLSNLSQFFTTAFLPLLPPPHGTYRCRPGDLDLDMDMDLDVKDAVNTYANVLSMDGWCWRHCHQESVQRPTYQRRYRQGINKNERIDLFNSLENFPGLSVRCWLVWLSETNKLNSIYKCRALNAFFYVMYPHTYTHTQSSWITMASPKRLELHAVSKEHFYICSYLSLTAGPLVRWGMGGRKISFAFSLCFVIFLGSV